MNTIFTALLLALGTGDSAEVEREARLDRLSAPTGILFGSDSVGAAYRLWFAEMEGDLQASDTGVPGTLIDVSSDLDLGRETVHELSAWLNIPFLGNLRGGWWSASFEGSETLTSSVAFSGTTFTSGTEVDTTMDLDVSTLMLDFDLLSPNIGGTGFEIALQIGGKYISASGELESSTVSAKEVIRGGIPVVGARITVDLASTFRVNLEANGLGFERDDIELRFVDAVLEIAWSPLPLLNIGAGWHTVQLLAQDDSSTRTDVEIDLEIGGPYLSVGVRF